MMLIKRNITKWFERKSVSSRSDVPSIKKDSMQKKQSGLLKAPLPLLNDPAPSVRVAAARALARMNRPKKALPVLIDTLDGPYQWARLQAAIVLDEMGPMARPAEEALKTALEDQPNKYITRVANHALNVMNGTHHTVK